MKMFKVLLIALLAPAFAYAGSCDKDSKCPATKECPKDKDCDKCKKKECDKPKTTSAFVELEGGCCPSKKDKDKDAAKDKDASKDKDDKKDAEAPAK